MLHLPPPRLYVAAFEKTFRWPEKELDQHNYKTIADLCKMCDELLGFRHLLEKNVVLPPKFTIGDLTVNGPLPDQLLLTGQILGLEDVLIYLMKNADYAQEVEFWNLIKGD
jgi:hypothetical protein